MEGESGGEGSEVFESLNLNPQLFINETLNAVDDLVDEAFTYYQQQASAFLKIEGTDWDGDLSKGVAYLRNTIRSGLDGHLGIWEEYCLIHCFKVPEGFSLTKSDELPDGSLASQNALMNTQFDTQLETLRHELCQAQKESAELSQELQALERQSVSSKRARKVVDEVLQSCEQNSLDEMYEELMRTADELRLKVGHKKTQRVGEKGIQRIEDPKIGYLNKDLPLVDRVSGLRAKKLGDLENLLSDLKQM